MRHCKKIVIWVVACLSLSLLFVGCGIKEMQYVPITTNTVELTSDGRIIAYIVEDFDKDYYDINELKTMVNEEIAEYNKAKAELVSEAGRTPVIVDKVTMAEDGSKKAVVALNFQNAAIYADYMGKEAFLGTVSDAINAGYVLEGMLVKVKGGELLIGEALKKNQDKTILIIKDAVTVRTYGDVLYLSKNAGITADGFVNAETKDELKYIIIK